MKLKIANPELIRQVALQMRGADFREFVATSYATSREELADELAGQFGARGDIIVACNDNETSLAVGGFLELRPRTMFPLFFAAPGWLEISKPLTKFIRKDWLPDILKQCHRLEAVAHVEHHESHIWMEFLFKMLPEGPPMRGFGKSGEIFQRFAWVSDDCPRCD